MSALVNYLSLLYPPMTRSLLLSLLLFFLLILPISAQENAAVAATPAPLTVEQVQERLDEYDRASLSRKYQIGNELFVQYEELADTLYQFQQGDGTSEGLLDFLTWYWSSEYAYDNDHFREALSMVRHALPDGRRHASPKDLAACLNLGAIACHRLADYGQSLEFAKECLDVSRQSGSDADVSMALNTIGGIYLAADTAAQGLPYVEEAIGIERRLGNQRALAVRLGMASDIHLRMGEPELALPLAQEALDCELELQAAGDGMPNPKVPVRQSQLAAVYMSLHDYAQAERLLAEACDAFRQQGNDYSLSVSLGQLGNCYVATGRSQQAVAPLEEALALCQQLGNAYIEAKAHHQLAQALAATQPQRAYDEMRRYVELREQIYQDQMAEKLQDFDAQYAASEKQHQLDLQQEQLKRSRLLLISLAVIALIALGLVIFAFRLASVRKRANQALIKASRVKDELLALAQHETEELRRHQLLQVAQDIEQMGTLPNVSLTPREQQIVALYAQGLLSKEVACQLGISVRTAETHKSHIYRKLGINNNVELLRYARSIGLLAD